MRLPITTFFLFIAILIFSSCVSNRKVANLDQSIENRKNLENKLDSTLISLNILREEKSSIGELDDSSSFNIKKVIDRVRITTRRRTDSLIEMQNRLADKRVKKKAYDQIAEMVNSSSADRSTDLETIELLDQLLKQQTFIRFNKSDFFPPGGYVIPEDKMIRAKEAFAPLIDSLISFVGRFPTLRLNKSIVTYVYTDGQGFSPGPLVDELTKRLGKTEATKEELNYQLTQLRAEEIDSVLKELFIEKAKNFPPATSLPTRFLITGKGEEYPNKKIRDYQVDDERRTIIVIFWNALPVGK
jgi:hypothetical protein